VSEVIISRVPYRPIQKGIAACLVKQALFIAALHRNIALQQTTCRVLAVRELDKVADRNCIVLHAFDIEALEIFRTGRSERIDDDPIF